MTAGEASVTVTVVVDGKVGVYELRRVRDFSIETRRDEPPYYRADPLRVRAEDPPRSIRFSMRPLPTNDDGQYMTVRITPEMGCP